jgi:plasmid maintenance system antidote protein VapI
MQEITRKNLRILLSGFMEKNNVMPRRVAKAIGCGEATIIRLLMGTSWPSDEMIKQVGMMIELGFDRYSKLTTRDKERLSDAIGTVAGGTIGFSAIYAAVSALGLSGVSAAGITSGLAALGSMIGGGMIAGVLVSAAFPIGGIIIGRKLAKHWASEKELNDAEFNPQWEIRAVGPED